MDDVEPKHAKPGDTIEITYEETTLFGKRFIVISEPEKSDTLISPGDAWIMGYWGETRVVSFGYYKIVKRSQETKSVDDFLQKQLDDNLGSIFG